jgi:dihydroxyacetone kinase
MIVVGDDIALSNKQNRRGLCGTLFIHKIAGYLKAQGQPVEEIVSFCEEAKEGIFTLGVSLNECSIPGQTRNDDRIAAGSIELGMGIHNEKGAKVIPYSSVSELVNLINVKLTEAVGNSGAGQSYACIINNLGSCSNLEMSIIVSEFLKQSSLEITHFMCGSFMTSLNMHGFSVSVIRLNNSTTEAALLAPVGAHTAWTGMIKVSKQWKTENIRVVNKDEEEKRKEQQKAELEGKPEISRTECEILKRCCEAIIAQSDHLTALDAKVGDGDMGTTLKNGAEKILKNLDNRLSMVELFAMMGTVTESIGGSIGVILSILFTAFSHKLNSSSSMAEALEFAISTVSTYGGAKVGDRTLLDSLYPALQKMQAGNSWSEITAASVKGAQDTAKLGKGAGRAAYLAEEDLIGHPDPGAVAVGIVFQSI